MSALALAMILTGAGEVQRGVPIEPHPPVPMVAPPAPPVPMPPAPGIRPNFVTPPIRARAQLNAYFSTDDYPAAAVRARHEGTTAFRLAVGPNGRVADCQIWRSSGSQPLDAATCCILRSRARYTPARGPDGAPTTGTDMGRVTWRLPDPPADRAGLAMAYVPVRSLTPTATEMVAADYPPGGPPAGQAGISILRVAVGRIGQVIGCDVEVSGGSAALDAAACRTFSARARFEPGRDAFGAVICDVTWVAVDWRMAAAGRSTPAPVAPTPPQPQLPPRPLREQLNANLCPGWTPS